MRISRLRVQNLRTLQDVVLEFNTPLNDDCEFPNVNVLLGGNGSGKTTVLRAAALAVLGPLLSGSSGFVPEGLIRRTGLIASRLRRARPTPKTGVATATLRLDPRDIPVAHRGLLDVEFDLSATISRVGDNERMVSRSRPLKLGKTLEALQNDNASHAFFVVGYGATRRVEASVRVDESARLKSRLRRYERVAGLFEDHIGLMPLSYWLPEFEVRNPGRFKQVVTLINALLPPECRMQGRATDTAVGREHLFEMNGIALPFRALSDGYRAYVGWIGDMLFHICAGVASGAKLAQTRGLVLVDEIDLHLHPEWQRTVLPTLAQRLPMIQFIVTTHSPLVVGSLQAANIFVLAQEGMATVVKRLPERIRGRNAEQILLSPYFGLETTRGGELGQELTELAAKAASGDTRASVRYLRLLSGHVEDATQPRARAKDHSARPAPTSAAAKRARAKAAP
jgi:AAA domain, putative AbiEii toxin, Type IV TA system/AAA domain